MKKMLYQGSNKNNLTIILNYLDDNNAEKIDEVDKTLLAEIINLPDKEYLDTILSRVVIHKILDKSVILDERQYFFHTRVIIFNEDGEKIRGIINNIRMLRSNFNIDEKINNYYLGKKHTILSPYILDFKLLSIYGSSMTSPIVRRNNLDNKYIDWYNYYLSTLIFAEQPVLGFTTDQKDVLSHHWQDFLYYYNTKPKLNIRINLYDNLSEAINERDELWFASYGLNYHSPDFLKANINSKLQAHILNNSLIISDNTNGYLSLKNKLLEYPKITETFNLILLNQYNIRSNKDFIINMTDPNKSSLKILKLYLINKNKIYNIYNNSSPRHIDSYRIDYRFENKKTVFLYSQIDLFSNLNGEISKLGSLSQFVIPFKKDQDNHLKALYYLNKIISATNLQDANNAGQDYLTNCIMDYNIDNTDILSKWFKMVNVNSVNDEEKLKTAYEKLKTNLINEYKDIQSYMENNNLSNKHPIPSLKLGKELSSNPEKTIDLYYSNRKITNINYFQLNEPIYCDTLNIRYIYKKGSSKNPIIYNGYCPYEELLDKNKNEIIIDINTLIKINDKINRRGR